MTLTQLWVTLYEASTVMEPTLIRKNLLLTDGQSLTHQPTNDNHSPRITVFTNRIQSVYNWKKGHVDTTSLLEEFLFSTVNFSPIFRTLALPLVPTFYIGFGFFISFKKACSKSRLGTRHQSIANGHDYHDPNSERARSPSKKTGSRHQSITIRWHDSYENRWDSTIFDGLGKKFATDRRRIWPDIKNVALWKNLVTAWFWVEMEPVFMWKKARFYPCLF